MAFRFRNTYWLWLSALVIIVDQITKQLIVLNVNWYESIPVMPHLNITYLKNTGAAFSMMSDMPPIFFVTLGVAVSLWIIWWLRANPRGQTFAAVAFSLILGGALGNVIDRVTRGFVVDFIDFYWNSWHFAAFNVADIAISVGAGFMILDMVVEGIRDRNAKKNGPENKPEDGGNDANSAG